MNKSFAAAMVAALAVMACGSIRAAQLALDDFSTYTAGTTISNLVENGDNIGPVGTWTTGENDESSIENDGSNYLKLQTEGSILTNTFDQAVLEEFDTALADLSGASKIYIKSTIKFEPSDQVEPTLYEGTSINNHDLKFALYLLQDDEAGKTNIVVYHSYYPDDDYIEIYTNDLIDVPAQIDITQPIDVTVTMLNSEQDLFFTVDLEQGANKVQLESAYGCTDEDLVVAVPTSSGPWFRSAHDKNSVSDTSVTSVNFQGTGEVRSLEVGTVSEQSDEKPGWADDTGDGSVTDKYWAWATDHAAGQDLYAEGADFMRQYLLNVDANLNVSLAIESVEVTDEGTVVVIAATAGEGTADLADINGFLDVSVSDDLSDWTRKSIPLNNLDIDDVTGKATVTIPAIDGAFVKASVELVEAQESLTDIGE